MLGFPYQVTANINLEDVTKTNHIKNKSIPEVLNDSALIWRNNYFKVPYKM